MEHELLHNEPPDYSVKQTNKTKKEKDKMDPGERKKWNFRKSSSSNEQSVNRSPSPTSGLINTSNEARAKRTISPTMIFENKINDSDYISQSNGQHTLPSAPVPIKSPAQQQLIPPRSASFDQPRSNSKRMQQKAMSLSSSPPIIARPQSSRKASDRIMRQTSAPATSSRIVPPPQRLTYQPSPVATEHFTTTPGTTSADDYDVRMMNTIDLATPSSQWGSVQQTLFTQSENISQEETNNNNRLQRTNSDRDSSTVGETLQDNTMWQGGKQQDLISGQWTDFSSNTNEVFVSDNTAWGVAENVAVEADEEDKDSTGEGRNSSNSSNSSESENEQEAEENVWKINEEQKAYYLNQFKALQPAEKGVVTGQTARDFFLKSGLSTDVLSRIWNLADLDNDGALNFDEFCIAMHVVVAVRHGLDVPTVLPSYLVPEHYEKQVPAAVSPQKVETASKEQLPVPDMSQKWARFSPDPNNPQPGQVGSPEEEATKTQQAVAPTGHQRVERSMSDPSSMEDVSQKETNTPARKTSVGIPRMRVNVKKTNLLDTPHWAILPPPSKFTKDAEDTGKSVPIGTIIPPDDSNDNGDTKVPQPGLINVENVERHSPRESHSSSSDEEDQKERPSSLTNEQLDSDSSGNLSKTSSRDSGAASHDSVDGTTKISAPVPPPRKKTGHSRSSSLDLQKLFNNKGGPNSFQNGTNDGEETSQQARDNQENFADFSKFENVTVNHPTAENTAPTSSLPRQRRSASLSSLDSTHAIWVEPSPPQERQAEQTSNSLSIPKMSASLPRPVPKKKPASPPPPLRQKKDAAQDSGSDGIIEKERKTNKEPIHFVVKPLTRLEQLHARIRDLKAKNTILSRVNNELQQELKQMMEKRIELESTVEQFKPLSNE